MMDEPEAETQVFCDRATFLALREEPAFHWILTLGRIVNSIRFVEAAIVERGGENAAPAARQTSSAILYLAALLAEALKFAARLGQHFRDSEAYRTGFLPLLNDAAVRELRDGLLHRLRN